MSEKISLDSSEAIHILVMLFDRLGTSYEEPCAKSDCQFEHAESNGPVGFR